MATNVGGLEFLLESAIEAPSRPGVFHIDAGALRQLLCEIVQMLKMSGEGPHSSLKASNDRLVLEVEALQIDIRQLDNEHSEGLIDGGSAQILGDLRDRVDCLEHKSGRKKSSKFETSAIKGSMPTQHAVSSHKRSLAARNQRVSIFEEVRNNVTALYRKLSTDIPIPPEPKNDFSTPFFELTEQVADLGMECVASVEDFLTALKNKRTFNPKILQELMIIFSSMDVDFFSLIVHAINQQESLTAETFADVLEFVLCSAFDAKAVAGLFTHVSLQSSKLTLKAFKELVNCVKNATKVSPSGLVGLLELMNRCRGLIEFIRELQTLESFSIKGLLNIAEEFHFSKHSSLAELVETMDKMTPMELSELMAMLLTIPGYMSELMYSLPKAPSLSTQKLLERLIALPDDSPRLLTQATELIVNSSDRKRNLVQFMEKALEVADSMEKDNRTNNGFFHLLKSLIDAEHVDLDIINEVLTLTTRDTGVSMNAVKALIQFSRDSPNDFIGAFTESIQALVDCPNMKSDVILRLLRLIEKAKLVNPRNIQDLLDMMKKSGVLKQDLFDKLIVLVRASQLNTPYVLRDFLNAIYTVDFLTLGDLAFALTDAQKSARKAYEEAVESRSKRDLEMKELKSLSSSAGSRREYMDARENTREDAREDTPECTPEYTREDEAEYTREDEAGYTREDEVEYTRKVEAEYPREDEAIYTQEDERSPSVSMDDDLASKMQELKDTQECILKRLDDIQSSLTDLASASTNTPFVVEDGGSSLADTPDTDRSGSEKDATILELQKEVKQLQTAVSILVEDVQNRRAAVISAAAKARDRPSSGEAIKGSTSKSSESSSLVTKKKKSKKHHQPSSSSDSFWFGEESARSVPSAPSTERPSAQYHAPDHSPNQLEQRITDPVESIEEKQTLEENAEEKDEEDELEAEKKSQQRVNSHFQEIEALVRQEGLRLEALKLRLDEHEQECERRHEWVTETLAQKVDGGELTLFKDAVRLQLYNFVNKRTPYGPAGAKQQIKVNCLSCDKKSYTTAVPAERTLPQAGAFPPVISQRPHTVYETDIIRRHGRSLLEGKTGGPDFYSLQRSCGGQHTSIDVRQTWTYEIHQKESLTKGGDGRLNPGGATHSPSKKGTRGTRSTEQLVAQMQFHNPPRP
ncbi:uncharacterized protein [Littorina saxatilis]|uniref:uncharacterized protein isoform X2 n=1 Tax=Littorina saxatilis TaxID=31220 RepID=UPI0038B53FA8